VVVNASQLRIEYHPTSDGAAAKTPDDFATVDLHTRKLVHFAASDIGRSEAIEEIRKSAATPHRHHHKK
jgi:hypothetical protein